MIIYLLLQGFDSILYFIVSLFPTFETPVWMATQLPEILRRIMSFNYYLPLYETITVVTFLLSTTLIYKVFGSIAAIKGLKL